MGFHPSFYEGRNVPDLPPDSYAYIEFWEEQKRRCLEGYSPSKHQHISGMHYYYINFCKIDRLDNHGRVVFDYPRYSEADAYIFSMLEKCQKEGKGLLFMTARGFGKSYLVASLVDYFFTFFPKSECIVSASIELYANNLWYKVKEMLEAKTEFYHSKLISNENVIISGYRYKDDRNQERIGGYQSKIKKVVYENKAGKTRGGRPTVHIFEEVGAWVGNASLIDCYNMSAASWWRGKYFTCLPVLIGTGGEMKSGGSRDAKHMFFNPEEFNLLAVEDPDTKRKSAIFIPAYEKLEGFYNEYKTERNKAKEFLEKERQKRENDYEVYEQYIQEYPFTVEEMFHINSNSPFSFLRERLYELEVGINTIEIQKGVLYRDENGKVCFRSDKNGWLQVVEHPETDENGDILENLYVAGIDSYDQSEALTSESQGSMMVFKRMKDTYSRGRFFVAQYTERPQDVYVFYERCMLLAEYYNIKRNVLVEYTKIAIIQYFEQQGRAMYLAARPSNPYNSIKRSVATNKYGLQMTYHTKIYCIDNYVKYARENKHKFYFKDQVLDHVEFNLEENRFDRTIASMLAVIQDIELTDLKVKELTGNKNKFPRWVRENGKFVFK